MKKLWNLFILCMLPCLVMLSSCRDEDIVALGMEEVSRADEALSSENDNANLVQDESTLRWTAKSRVALVGEGRVLNNMAPALVNVLGGTSSADALTDRDLTNGMKLNDGVGTDLFGNQLASVKDLNRVYEGGQKVGFVYKASSGGVLSLDLLKAFWIKTYLDGKPQESSTSTGNDGFKLLNLNVISVAGKATKEAAITTTLPFDEVKIGIGTLTDIGVLTQFELLYAFVGDDPELIAATGHDYPNASSDGGLGIFPFPSHKELVNEKLTDGPNIELLSSLAGGPWFTVDFEKNIPAGYEVGFKQQSGDVLEVNLGGLTLFLLDENDKELAAFDMGSVLGVSALGGGISYISAINTFSNCRKLKIDYPLGLKIGDTQLFYAYARKAEIEPDVSANYSIGNDRTSYSYYKIPSVKVDIGGKVQYAVTGPAGASPYVENGVIKGMTVNGDYKLTAIYCDDNGNQFTQTVIITRERVTLASTCNQMLINSSANKNNDYEFTAEPVKGVSSGAVVDVWTHLKDTQNLVDADFGNYVSFTNIINVIQFRGILALQSNKPINVDKQKIRTGFTLQTTSTLLNLNLLKFFTIRLWNGDEVVYDGVADENRGVDVGLIGNSGSRIRCAIETSEAFDRIELFCYSVANINLGDFLRIYYAFWEPADECQSSSMVEDACQEMLTPGNSNLHFVFDDGNTGSTAVANIGNSFNNMANALDNDADSYAVLTDVVTVIGKGAEVTLKFNEVTASETAPKPIGVIYSTPDHLGDVNVLSAVIFKVYDNGKEIYRNTVGNLADIDLLGYSGKIYAETYLNKPFDQVSLEFPETVGALNSIYLYGVYTRFDDDNNGIPDCSEDPEEDQSIKLNYVKTTEDVCELLNSDGSMSGYGTVRIYVKSGSEIALTVGERYSLYYYTVSGGSSEKVTVTSILNKDSEGTYLEFRIPVGEHYFYGFDNYDAVLVKVHPLLTKWAGTYNTDWNNWSNWTRGAPWTCTNVIIPSSAPQYPELEGDVTNCCAGIHFEPGGEVVNTHYLNYDAAWVDMELEGERYYMLSAPLKDMYTGDIFISKDSQWGEEANYFSEMNEESYIEYRVTPRIYQRLWSSVARGVTLKDGYKTVTPGETFWTAPFNAVNTRFEMGQGFSVKAEGLSSNRFYFPKMHKIYNYFYSTGNPTGKFDRVKRTGNGYRFIYEGAESEEGTWQVTLKNTEGHNNGKTSTFLLGNPFMAHVNIQEFLKRNENVLTGEVKVYDGNTLNSEIKADGQLLSYSEKTYTHIAPMQSVFVKANNNEQGSITVTFTEDMLTQKPEDKVRSRAVSSGIQQKGIRITATDGETESRCLLLKRSGATDACRAGEDAEVLIDPATAPSVVVFTVADDKALDIQQFQTAKRIPLGFVVKEEVTGTTLKFSFAEKEWNGWVLKDTETGKRYDLKTGNIVIGNLKSNIGRLYLEKIN